MMQVFNPSVDNEALEEINQCEQDIRWLKRRIRKLERARQARNYTKIKELINELR